MRQNYAKRETIPNAGHGNDFQIHYTMFSAFVCAYQHNISFHLSTEDTAFGDFDDVVITYSNGEVDAMQLKHLKDINEQLGIGALANQSGKFSVKKHLASLITAKKITQHGGLAPGVSLCFVSNASFHPDIIPHINQATGTFNEAFYQRYNNYYIRLLNHAIEAIPDGWEVRLAAKEELATSEKTLNSFGVLEVTLQSLKKLNKE